MQGQQASVRAFASSVLAQLNIGSAHSQAAMVMFNDVGTTTHEMSASRPDLISAIEEYGTKFRVSSGTNITDRTVVPLPSKRARRPPRS